MIVETAQLLCTAHRIIGSDVEGLYRSTHKNHPCAVWVRESAENYKWALKLLEELCIEYTFRYGKIHKTSSLIEKLRNFKHLRFSSIGLTKFAQVMSDEFRGEDIVQSYRLYYRVHKTRMLNYKRRERPQWLEAN